MNSNHKRLANQSEIQNTLRAYAPIEARVMTRWLNERASYNVPVNFEEALRTPRHRWFPYKEGFSPNFVRKFLAQHVTNGIVLDPFAGVGTTLVESSLAGIRSIGYETNPLAHFVSLTKLQRLVPRDFEDLEDTIHRFRVSALSEEVDSPQNATVVSYFTPRTLDNILRVKKFYMELPNDKVANLFKLALLAGIEVMSTHRKAGNGVKRKVPQKLKAVVAFEDISNVRLLILGKVKQYREDCLNSELKGASDILLESSLTAHYPAREGEINCVLTSPPYANCFDYSKIYLSELWLGDFFRDEEQQKEFRMESVRSHVHATWPNRNEGYGSEIVQNWISPAISELDLWSNKIPGMVRGYFEDIGRLLENLHPYLNHSAPLGFVVANSAYGGIPVATDLLIAELGWKSGYEVDCIEVYRRVVPASQQFPNIDQIGHLLRESLVLLRKAPRIHVTVGRDLENVYSHSSFSKGVQIDFPSTRNFRQYSHRIFNRYPARSISLVPRAILQNLRELRNDHRPLSVLDPFMGSGTTAVEARLQGMIPFGVEIDPFARMVSEVKTYRPSEKEMDEILNSYGKITASWFNTKPNVELYPSLDNVEYWFHEKQFNDLLKLKTAIMENTRHDSYADKFFRLILADIVRPCSKAERQSLKPYISKKHNKTPAEVGEAFVKSFENHFAALQEFASVVPENIPIYWLGYDGTDFTPGENPIDVAISSPPYLNALDYVRCIKLESTCAHCSTGNELQDMRRFHLGEAVRQHEERPLVVDAEIAPYVGSIATQDPSRGKIVLNYFTDMFRNMQCVYEALNEGRFYHLIVGDSVIRNVEIPTHAILGKLSEKIGFRCTGFYYYRIKDHRTSIPRNGNGGKIDKEYVISLEKT